MLSFTTAMVSMHVSLSHLRPLIQFYASALLHVIAQTQSDLM